MISTVLFTAIVAPFLWIAMHFLEEWPLRWRCPPGSKLPPMPPMSGIRGHVEILGCDSYRKKSVQWAKDYGPVVRLKVNFINVVILNDLDSIKAFGNTKETLDRSPFFFGSSESPSALGNTVGELWWANRKFCASALNGSGHGKRFMEDLMTRECNHLVDSIAKTNGKPLDVQPRLTAFVFNNIASFLYGAKLTRDHPTRRELQRLMQQRAVLLSSAPEPLFLPRALRRLLKWLPFTQNHRFENIIAKLDALIMKQVEECKAQMGGDETGDFILSYTKKIEHSKHESYPLFTDHLLVSNISALSVGATMSPARVLIQHMLNFAKNPDTVQALVQREIDDVVGHQRQPTWEDRKQMPYTMACIWEMLRWKSVARLAIAKICSEDVVVSGFFIRKGTVVVPNAWAVHSDPNLWKDPGKFKPERYLSEDGKSLLHKPKQLIPFSVGPRACPGEEFATMELFLLVTFLLQKYRILLEPSVDYDLDSPNFDISPLLPIMLRFLPRFTGNC